jgi:hypothetical protein
MESRDTSQIQVRTVCSKLIVDAPIWGRTQDAGSLVVSPFNFRLQT